MSENNHPEQEVINRVLFVDDEPNILSSLRRGLAREKYLKFFALNADEALYILEEHEIHVIVSDMRMPGMNGLDLLKLVSEKYPNVVKIVLSGYTQLPQVLATINQVDIYKFIPKPWNMEEEFIPLIRGAIAHYNMQNGYRQFRNTIEKQNQFYQKLIKQNDEKFNALKRDFDHFNSLYVELNKYASELIKTPEFENTTPEQFSSYFLSISSLLSIYTNVYPLDLSNFTPEKLRTEINQLFTSLFKPPETETAPFVGKPPVSKDDPLMVTIKNDGYSGVLNGHYKLYLAIQKIIIIQLLSVKSPQELSLSQVYSLNTHELIMQYEVPHQSFVKSKWDLQLTLFILRHAHTVLTGKLDFHMNEQSVKIISIFKCKEQ